MSVIQSCPFRSLTGTETGPVDISDFIDLLDDRLREAGERYLPALYEAFGQEHLEAEHHKKCPVCPDTANKQEILKMLNFAGSFALQGQGRKFYQKLNSSSAPPAKGEG